MSVCWLLEVGLPTGAGSVDRHYDRAKGLKPATDWKLSDRGTAGDGPRQVPGTAMIFQEVLFVESYADAIRCFAAGE